jgi:MscS family membrane protein
MSSGSDNLKRNTYYYGNKIKGKMMLKTLLTFILLTTNSYANLETPRDTMKTFLKSMVQVKSDSKNLNSKHDELYAKAISTLDLSNFTMAIKKSVGKKYANQLIFIFDRMEKIKYSNIPLEAKNDYWLYDKRHYDDATIEISMQKIDGTWKFSKWTLDSLEHYSKIYEHKEVASNVLSKIVQNQFRSKLPEAFQNKVFFLENWQWLGLIILLFLAFIVEKITGVVVSFIIHKNFKIFKLASSDHLENMINPFRKLLFVVILIPGIQYLDLKVNTLTIFSRVLMIVASFMSIWLAHRVVEMISYYFQQKSVKTENKFDDILVPLLTKTVFIFVYLLGGVYIAYSLTIDVTGLIAGLGIGGLAFAFAAKDTLANFFASIMLVLDRPFDIGDYIVTGDIEGLVEEVGFRSTRIRTFYDSVITISNGELVNRSIDNKGKRRFRRLTTTLGLEYDTPPELIEAFCEGIRQLILNHKWTRKDSFHVYFVNFGASSLDIQLVVFWETGDYAREQSEKHRLMIDILRIAKDIGVNFAFPTQTVHMFNETTKPNFKVNEKYFEDGIQRAKNVTSKPLSLKNPRSNAKDNLQFGGNDIGLE